MKRIMKKLFSLFMIIAIVLSNYMPFMPMDVVKATGVLSEININSERNLVGVGELPVYTATTTTEHASVEAYGSNTNWSKWEVGNSSWHGFGSDTPTAVADETHYALRLSVNLDDGYSFDANTKIKFNGVDVSTKWHTMIDPFSWGGYVYIDLGSAWNEPLYRVTYDFNGGTRFGSGTYTNYQVSYAPYISEGNFIEYMEVTPPSGKVLDAIEINEVRHELGSEYMLNCNTTYKYLWKDNPSAPVVTTHSVTFELNNGTMTGTNPVTVNDGEAVARPANDPTRSGYAFVNWYSDAGLTTLFDFSTTITEDKTVYAKWDTLITSASATITAPIGGEHPSFTATSGNPEAYSATVNTWYDLDNNGAHLTDSDFYVAGNEYQARVHFTAKPGYQFADSVTYTINGTPNYTVFETAQQRGMNFTATAPAVTTHNVTFELNDGTMTGTNPVTVNDGEKVSRPTTDPVKENNLFVDWYSDAGLTTLFDFDSTITKDTTIYAKFTLYASVAIGTTTGGKYSITNTGAYNETGSMNMVFLLTNNPVTFTATPDEGYHFVGWYEGVIGESHFVENHTSTLISSNASYTTSVTNLVIRAVFEEDDAVTTYTVTFDKNGGTGTMDDVTGLTGTYTLPANGFTAPANKQFKGWSLTSNGEIITTVSMTEDRTVYAIWEDIPAGTYTILDGNNQTYTLGSNTDIIIRASGDKDKIISIEIDGGNVIDSSNYELSTGSTILRLKSSFLENSSIGTHTITFKYDDGEVDATLTIAKAANNNTNSGNSSNNNNNATNTNNNNTNNSNTNNPQTSYDVVNYIYSLIFGIICLAGGSIYIKRKNLFGNN